MDRSLAGPAAVSGCGIGLKFFAATRLSRRASVAKEVETSKAPAWNTENRTSKSRFQGIVFTKTRLRKLVFLRTWLPKLFSPRGSGRTYSRIGRKGGFSSKEILEACWQGSICLPNIGKLFFNLAGASQGQTASLGVRLCVRPWGHIVSLNRHAKASLDV